MQHEKNKIEPSTRFLIALGLPSLGLTFAVTILTVYLPTLLRNFTGPTFIGLILGIEGIFGLIMPFVAGALSDRATTVKKRFNYLIPATVLIVIGLVLAATLNTLFVIVPAVAFFYAGYFAYLSPYWSLYPDLIPKTHSGRSRSAEGSWQVIGSFFALLGGGFLLGIWHSLPFVIAAAVMIVVTITLYVTVIRKRQNQSVPTTNDNIHQSLKYTIKTIKESRDLRYLTISNGFWYAALHSIRSFVVLFFIEGLNHSAHFVSGIVFPIAAIGMIVMAPLSGKLADKYGHHRVLTIALVIYALGSIIPAITQTPWVMLTVPFVAGAGATVMILPQSVLMRLINGERHGVSSALLGVSRGVGSSIGPLLTGIAIASSKNIFGGTHGYAALWLMVSIFILFSIPFFWRIQIPEKQPRLNIGY
jgi:MFS family permease